jgi:arginyl-tRNA synthetase
MGDLAFPCFTLAKEAKKAPQVLAMELASQLSENLPSEFVKIIAVGPYVNAFVDGSTYVKAVLANGAQSN